MKRRMELGYIERLEKPLPCGSSAARRTTAYVEAIRDGQRLAAATTLRPALVVQVVDPGSPIPPALWRRRIAEASSQVPAHVLFVLVSSSPAVRAVSTALAWLRPLTHEQSAVSTIGEAITLVENRRQGSGAVVERLHREVRAALRR